MTDSPHQSYRPRKWNSVRLTRRKRLGVIITISFSFFVAEITIGFYTRSLALIADAFHYLNDFVAFIIAFMAVQVTEKKRPPADLSFGWVRAQVLGGFFNGAFLVALGLSIALQSIQRFIWIEKIENPRLILIVGCVGVVLNLISATFLHEHDRGPEHNDEASEAEDDSAGIDVHTSHLHITTQIPRNSMDLGLMGIFVHILGDVINNISLMICAIIIWFGKSPLRFYADPAASMFIALVILASTFPLLKRSGRILLQSVPVGVNIDHVKRDLESIPGVVSVHELHIWRLDQKKAVASAHIVVSDLDVQSFMEKAKIFSKCLHAYGIHSLTLQPEVLTFCESGNTHTAKPDVYRCRIQCGTMCEAYRCCVQKDDDH